MTELLVSFFTLMSFRSRWKKNVVQKIGNTKSMTEFCIKLENIVCGGLDVSL